MNASDPLRTTIKETVAALQGSMVQWRRHLHRYPELSFQEHATAAYVAHVLRVEGVALQEGVGRITPDAPGTGLIALVKGEAGPSDRCFALRADLDALPITEEGKPEYCSTQPGVMHACGHDAHTAMVLGAGIALHRLRKEWSGTVMLVFQPGEEKHPGGASLLLAEGAIQRFHPSGILGQHVTPELPAGVVAFRSGPFMAAADELYLTVKGRGGHAAQRTALVDPILITARLIPALYEAVSAVKGETPVVLSFGKVIANGATNIVPDTVAVEGTLRTFNDDLRASLHALITARARAVAAEMGGGVDVHILKGYPVVRNDEALTDRVRRAALDLLGPERVLEADLRMGAEDFGHYTKVMPGCFYRLGTGNPLKAGTQSGLHTASFDVDEDVLQTGASVMAACALGELQEAVFSPR